MIDDFAKDNLRTRLRRDREALLWKLDGVSEYNARRPLTATGTNLLGLVKHVATVEARYFGEANRHAGHADILREGLDGRTGMRPEHEKHIDEEARAAYRAKIERVARSAAPNKG
ncbi:DUF664 domain-containing protein [Kitasatospora sp. NPDC098652]|uniref:mycothiol transferase n=1 Tax=Kitasatospora sp. NPDC098652 TaxID=3364095 RepID=UPI003821F3F1